MTWQTVNIETLTRFNILFACLNIYIYIYIYALTYTQWERTDWLIWSGVCFISKYTKNISFSPIHETWDGSGQIHYNSTPWMRDASRTKLNSLSDSNIWIRNCTRVGSRKNDCASYICDVTGVLLMALIQCCNQRSLKNKNTGFLLILSLTLFHTHTYTHTHTHTHTYIHIHTITRIAPHLTWNIKFQLYSTIRGISRKGRFWCLEIYGHFCTQGRLKGQSGLRR